MPRKKENPLEATRKSLITFFTQTGKQLPKNKKQMIALAKEEMRILFGT
jgi:hypothetical protein